MADRQSEIHEYDNDGALILAGSANAYTATTARPITGYFAGLRVCAKANHTNTGAATLNLNGIGAAAIRKHANAALATGDIVSGQYYDFLYDAANSRFQIMDAVSSGSSLNVRDYGAVGDGTTDDAAAFQAAVNAASASTDAKRVYVPHAGSGYVIGTTITIPSGVIVYGDNLWGQELSRIKPKAAFTDPIFKSDGYSTGRVLRIGICGLFIDGSSTTLTAIQVRCQESIFQHLTIKNCFTYGLHLGGYGSGASEQALNNHITDCYLSGIIATTEFFDGIFIDYYSADNTLTQNYVEATKDAGIRSRGYNNKITNNHIYSVAGTGGGVGCGIYVETSSDQDISQNYVELCAAEGVICAGGGSDVETLAGTISGNVFRNIDTGDTSNGVIELSGSDISGLSVYGNVVRRDASTSYATPYFVYFDGISPTDVKVFGNVPQSSSLVTTSETNLTGVGFLADDAAFSPFTLGTEQATTSGTSFDFTGISAGAFRITVMFNEVSLSGTDNLLVQVGDSGGVETTGYVSSGDANGTAVSSTSGFIGVLANAARIFSGHMVLTRMNSSHLWISSHAMKSLTNITGSGGGSKTLSAELDRVRITTTGSNTFDSGSVNILIEN